MLLWFLDRLHFQGCIEHMHTGLRAASKGAASGIVSASRGFCTRARVCVPHHTTPHHTTPYHATPRHTTFKDHFQGYDQRYFEIFPTANATVTYVTGWNR